MSAAALRHVRDDEFAAEEGAADVHAVEKVPVSDPHTFDGAGYEDGSVVDEDVYASPSFDGLLVHGGEVVFLGDVAADADGLATFVGDSVHGGLDAAGYSEVAFVFGAGGDDDLSALAGEHDRHVSANAPARAGDYGYLAIKFSHDRPPEVLSFLALRLPSAETSVLFHESPRSILGFETRLAFYLYLDIKIKARLAFHLDGVYRRAGQGSRMSNCSPSQWKSRFRTSLRDQTELSGSTFRT